VNQFIARLAALWLAAAMTAAIAQDYPSRPVTVVVPFVAGGVVDLMARPRLAGEGAPAPPKVGRTMLIVIGRYALLALLAYVMIARLRLHPLGLLAGASSVVAAAAIEAGRQITKKS